MTDRLTVSAIIPAYNSQETIERALTSVIQQERAPDLIVVVDDCSSDNTPMLAEEILSNNDIPYRILHNKINVGPGVSRNRGIMVCDSDLVAFLDADDIWMPNKIRVQAEFFEKDPGVFICGHPWLLDSMNAQLIEKSIKVKKTTVLSAFSLLTRNRFSTPSVMMRRSSYRFGDGHYSEDYLLWLRVVTDGNKALYLPDPLFMMFKPAVSSKGLSSNLFKMGRAEISNFFTLYKERRISLLSANFFAFFSFLKLCVRVFRFYFAYFWKGLKK
ncbi:glycosyltransferase family 2 protein [Alcanivorax sp. ZXX171]|nr:glycosyltransferase family 2 protein [Alcanivorax sp. ZXX171]